ncbi:hypothetical protein BKA70DRAFT_1356224 [Coprinopsis sp. MPI-PUGE-AT-0042]|nr:hypothetical protein BKA70DRAFT_1356224 [Coprinopsis sp. MPI-PUGE-AT-0042]
MIDGGCGLTCWLSLGFAILSVSGCGGGDSLFSCACQVSTREAFHSRTTPSPLPNPPSPFWLRYHLIASCGVSNRAIQ